MPSLFYVPAQLALALSLAASTAGDGLPSPAPAFQTAIPSSQATFASQSLVGPFRFSEGIWLRALKENLSDDDANGYSRRIFKTSGGRFYVPVAEERREILVARWNTALAGRMARTFAQANARRIGAALHRPATAGDLYVAHVFGPEAAIDFITLAETKPGEAAADHMPELAQAAPNLFYERNGPLTLAHVYKRLTGALGARPRGIATPPKSARRALLGLKPTLLEQVQRASGPRLIVSEATTWQPQVSAARRPPLQ